MNKYADLDIYLLLQYFMYEYLPNKIIKHECFDFSTKTVSISWFVAVS